MCGNAAFGVASVIDQLTDRVASQTYGVSAMKATNSNKALVGKYQTMAKVLAKVGDIPEAQLYKSLNFSAAGLVHALQDVRLPSQKCIVELYRYLGDEVRTKFGGLRQAQIDQIEQMLT